MSSEALFSNTCASTSPGTLQFDLAVLSLELPSSTYNCWDVLRPVLEGGSRPVRRDHLLVRGPDLPPFRAAPAI